MWDDIIGEPEGIKSTQCAWNCSFKCFRCTKNCCYILLTTLFAPCLAFFSAINFACLAFQVSINSNENDKINISPAVARLVYDPLPSKLENLLRLLSNLFHRLHSGLVWTLRRSLRPLLCQDQSPLPKTTRQSHRR